MFSVGVSNSPAVRRHSRLGGYKPALDGQVTRQVQGEYSMSWVIKTKEILLEYYESPGQTENTLCPFFDFAMATNCATPHICS